MTEKKDIEGRESQLSERERERGRENVCKSEKKEIARVWEDRDYLKIKK